MLVNKRSWTASGLDSRGPSPGYFKTVPERVGKTAVADEVAGAVATVEEPAGGVTAGGGELAFADACGAMGAAAIGDVTTGVVGAASVRCVNALVAGGAVASCVEPTEAGISVCVIKAILIRYQIPE